MGWKDGQRLRELGERGVVGIFVWALELVLITLKLSGIGEVAAWSWWLVLAPLWVPFVVVVAIVWVTIAWLGSWSGDDA